MNRIYHDFDSYKNIILQEIIFEQYYLSNQDAIEHLNLFIPQLYQFFNKRTPISTVKQWIMSYDYCVK